MIKRLARAVLAALVLMFMLALPASADTQYLWILSDAQIVTSGPGVMIAAHTYDPQERVEDLVYGGTDYTCSFCTCDRAHPCAGRYEITCQHGFCAAGRFIYTKNPDLSFSGESAHGLNFSPVQENYYQEIDKRTQTAFAFSSVAIQAALSGFLTTPMIQYGIATMLALNIARLVTQAIYRTFWKREGVPAGQPGDDEPDDPDKEHSKDYIGPGSASNISGDQSLGELGDVE